MLIANVAGTGMQMVQPRRIHGVGAGVRGPCDRLARVGAQVLLGPLLQTALHVSAWGLHQGPELRRAGLE